MTEFSVKNAVLYRVGVGWFSAEGEVNDDVIYFPVASSSLDDFLKTSLIGIKGGKAAIKNLSFETKGVSKSLFSTSNVVVGIIDFLRGSVVDISVFDGKELNTLSGRILGYQELDSETPILMISMLTSSGEIKLIDGMSIVEILPKSEKDITQLNEFLASLANESDNESQTLLKIQLTNKGDFALRVSFLTNIPAWKLAYRAIINEEDISLETYGIVDNNTLVDWMDATLTLSTKNPVSFRYDLSTPHEIFRPEISRAIETGISIPELSPSPAPTINSKRRAGSMQRMNQVLMAETAIEEYDDDEYGMEFEEQASIELGESIEYKLIQPVTIKRKQSSMVPLSIDILKGVKKHYYNKNNHITNPFYVVEFINTLHHALDNGPISVYEKNDDGDDFKGEAMLSRIGKNDEYLLSYALDKNISIINETDNYQFHEKIKIDGILKKDTYSSIKVLKYDISNKGDMDTELYIAVGKSEYKPLEKPVHGYNQTNKFKTVKDEYRIIYDCVAQSTNSFKFIMVYQYEVTEYLYQLSEKKLKKLLDDDTISQKEKDIIKAIYEISIELTTLRNKKENLNQKYSRFKDRREQIISTLEVLDKNTEGKTRKKYVDEIESIDTSITALLKQIEKISDKINKLQKNQQNKKQLNARIKNKTKK